MDLWSLLSQARASETPEIPQSQQPSADDLLRQQMEEKKKQIASLQIQNNPAAFQEIRQPLEQDVEALFEQLRQRSGLPPRY